MHVPIQSGHGRGVLDASELPSATYDLEIKFYPKWGFKDNLSRSTGISEPVSASTTVYLKGSGTSVEEHLYRQNAQRWLMSEVVTGYKWNEPYFRQRLGNYQSHPIVPRYR